MASEGELAARTTNAAVLVVDDDAGVRAVLKRWLEQMGCAVTLASGADAAVSLMRDWRHEVAVCDVRMPGHDGIWLVDQLRREHPYTSIVLATGMAALDPHITLRDGVVGYIVKPFDRALLAEMIQRGLDDCRERALREARRSRRLLGETVIEGIIVEESEPVGFAVRP